MQLKVQTAIDIGSRLKKFKPAGVITHFYFPHELGSRSPYHLQLACIKIVRDDNLSNLNRSYNINFFEIYKTLPNVIVENKYK